MKHCDLSQLLWLEAGNPSQFCMVQNPGRDSHDSALHGLHQVITIIIWTTLDEASSKPKKK